MMKAKPYAISNIKCQFAVLIIIIMLGPLLHLMETLSNLMDEGHTILEVSVHSCNLGLARDIVTKMRRWSAIDDSQVEEINCIF
jgi:Cft2 family RNA processing exonuclease